jgi:hypothetical protein
MIQENEIKKTVARNQDLYLLACSVLLGVLFDILFFKKSLGLSYLLFVLAFYAAFLGLLHHKIAFKLTFGWFLTIPILALSSTYFIFSNLFFGTLNFLLLPVLIVGQTLLITRENKYKWFDVRFLDDIVNGIFTRTFCHINKLFALNLGSLNPTKSDKKQEVVKKILIGLLISLPLLLVIILLLASADLVFSHYFEQIINWFKNLNLGDFIAQVLLFFIITLLSFSYLWSFLKSKKTIQDESSVIRLESKTMLDPVITITVLSLVNFVYLIFILIQFAFMFTSKNTLPPNITYAQYARKGFFELLTVTLINFTILLIGITFKPKDSKATDKVMKILHSLLVVFTMVILVSAYKRMSIYEAAFGFTYLRVLTHSFMMVLFVLFLVALYKIWVDRISLLKSYIVVSLIAYMVINFINIDSLITARNIERYHTTGDLDTHYLTKLSYDSIPALVDLYIGNELSNNIKLYLEDAQDELSKKQDWPSFNLSKLRAKRALSRLNNK